MTDMQFVFTVIGVYKEEYQRFAENYAARDANDAETQALAEHPTLIIAGVIDMRGEVVA